MLHFLVLIRSVSVRRRTVAVIAVDRGWTGGSGAVVVGLGRLRLRHTVLVFLALQCLRQSLSVNSTRYLSRTHFSLILAYCAIVLFPHERT